MEDTVLERSKNGHEVIENAMEMLVVMYNTIPEHQLDETEVSFKAGNLCEVFEMLFAYVHESEDVDIQELMDTVNMELAASFTPSDDDNEPQIH